MKKTASERAVDACNTKYRNYIKRWKAGQEDGMRGSTGLSRHLRKYLLEKYDHSCSLCGWNKINPTTGVSPLEVDHIDGDYKNNEEENLRVLCPNCHALTPTFKALNAGKGRETRYK